MAQRLAAYFALATAAGLIVVWGAAWADVLPAAFVPRQLATSHVVAELATAGALLLGALLTLRSGRAHWTLAAGLGALAYASINVMGDFSDEPVMLMTLAATLVLTLVALGATFRTTSGSDAASAGKATR